MKSICFVGNFTAGGTERATFLLANTLSSENKIFIINTSEKKPFFKLDKSIEVYYLHGASKVSRILNLIKYLREKKIDVLITVEALTGMYTLPAALIARCKNIIWEHANFYQTQNSKYMNFIRRLELLLASAYVVLTKRDKYNFRQHFKIRCPLENIYNMIPEQSASQYNIDSKIILSAGHHRPIKNFSVIPDIGACVFDKHPDWQWHIYGTCSGESYELLKNKIEKAQLSNNILLFDRSENMDKVYSGAAMYVMTSLMEGLPMVLLEAKSHKLPLISFDIETGPDEIIRQGEDGFLVEAYSIQKMADKICELIENQEHRLNMSECSHENLNLFSEQEVVQKWKKLLKALKNKG